MHSEPGPDGVERPVPVVPFGRVAGEERWLASELALTVMWVATVAVLVIPQLWWWPIIGGDRVGSWLLGGTPFAATVPLLVYLWVKGDRVFPRWAMAHGFRFEAAPRWSIPNWGIAPFNSAEAYSYSAANAMEGKVNGYPARYFTMSGRNREAKYQYVFALQLPRALPHLSLTAQIDPDRSDAIGYQVTEAVQPFYRYGADAVIVREVFNPDTLSVVVAILPGKMRNDIRFDTVDNVLVATTSRGFRAEQITAVFLAMYAICTGIPSTAWLSGDGSDG